MNAIRKTILAAVTAVTLASPVHFLPSVAAHEAQHVRQYSYWIGYRSCPDEPWQYFGPYGNAAETHRIVATLRTRGYDAFAVKYRK